MIKVKTFIITTFKRRKPEESNIENLKTLDQIYDYIRMLDGEGYPKAFIETEHFKVEFSRTSLKQDGIIADAKIILKEKQSKKQCRKHEKKSKTRGDPYASI